MSATARKSRNKQDEPGPATARLEARISKPQKVLFERAATLRGQTLTDFVIESLREAAVKTVEEHNFIRLTIEDQRRFVEALMSPPAPNTALKKAAQRYRKMRERLV